ncbi:MAG: hypothetical protein QNJ98_15500 [Planctomycetota bacterium]|nr:hypothetical protein [Planctomycetota bacterium]
MTPPTSPAWHEDPLEVDRLLDGELEPELQRAREAEIAADPGLAQRVGARRAFLTHLARSGAAVRAGHGTAMPIGLEARVQAALGQGARRPARRLIAYAAAAVLMLGLGLFILPRDDAGEAVAAPPAVLVARDALEGASPQSGGCAENDPTSPFAFPPVRAGELDVVGCDESPTRPGLRPAILRGREETVGFVAVPEPGTRSSPKVGKTILGDVVVYDILYGDTRAYLAARADFVAERGDCVACHNRSRDGQKNPHYIELRRWVVK